MRQLLRFKTGQALVEFALAATLIFFLLAAAVDLGLIFFTIQGLHNAAQDGARLSRSCRRPRLPGSGRLGHSRSLAQGDRGTTAVSDSRSARRQHATEPERGRCQQDGRTQAGSPPGVFDGAGDPEENDLSDPGDQECPPPRSQE